jgi:DNA repair exonuclease SbcCD ATPase subunit
MKLQKLVMTVLIVPACVFVFPSYAQIFINGYNSVPQYDERSNRCEDIISELKHDREQLELYKGKMDSIIYKKERVYLSKIRNMALLRERKKYLDDKLSKLLAEKNAASDSKTESSEEYYDRQISDLSEEKAYLDGITDIDTLRKKRDSIAQELKVIRNVIRPKVKALEAKIEKMSVDEKNCLSRLKVFLVNR